VLLPVTMQYAAGQTLVLCLHHPQKVFRVFDARDPSVGVSQNMSDRCVC